MNASPKKSRPLPSASRAEQLASLSPAERLRWLENLSEEEIAALEFEWPFWARPAQIAPAGEWSVWLILAGRGFGKTRSGAEWTRAIACGSTPLAPGLVRHIALVGQTAADVRKVIVGDGVAGDVASGILQVHPPDFRPDYNPSLKRLTWPNGCVASLFNATEPEELRGPQFDAAWCDELAKWQYAQETWDMLQFGLRLGIARACVTTTPKPTPLLRDIIKDEGTVVSGGSTYENAGNLSPKFLEKVVRRYEGTRLGRQELQAEILDDVPGALWQRAQIDALRVTEDKVPPMARIVIGVDPSGSDGNESEEREAGDDIGIVAVGRGVDGHLYVLEDATCNESPAGWGKAAVELYKKRRADRIVGERNFGGAMVGHVIRTADPSVAYKDVQASRGKWVRAEPVSALYEQKRVHHVGAFPDMEDELCNFGVDGMSGGRSPNRLDALVWAVTELELADGNMIFSADERDFVCEPFRIPPHWERVAAIDCDGVRFACVWGAISDEDTLYVVGEYAAEHKPIAVNASAARKAGKWMPVVLPALSRERDKAAAQQLVDELMDEGVNLFTVDEGTEAGIEVLKRRFTTHGIKVFSTMTGWIAEYRRFRRDEKGEIAKDKDHLMRATCTLALSGHHVAISQAVALGGERVSDFNDGRSETTGY